MINGRVAMLRIITCVIGAEFFPYCFLALFHTHRVLMPEYPAMRLMYGILMLSCQLWDYHFHLSCRLLALGLFSASCRGSLGRLTIGRRGGSDEEVERLSKRFSEIFESGKLTSEPQEGKSTG